VVVGDDVEAFVVVVDDDEDGAVGEELDAELVVDMVDVDDGVDVDDDDEGTARELDDAVDDVELLLMVEVEDVPDEDNEDDEDETVVEVVGVDEELEDTDDEGVDDVDWIVEIVEVDVDSGLVEVDVPVVEDVGEVEEDWTIVGNVEVGGISGVVGVWRDVVVAANVEVDVTVAEVAGAVIVVEVGIEVDWNVVDDDDRTVLTAGVSDDELPTDGVLD
jgi:hypothetical protein